MRKWWARKPIVQDSDLEILAPAIPVVEVIGADVSVSVAPPSPPENHGERHSRLWVQFLTGSVEMLEDEVSRGIGDLDEKRAQIADKKQQIAIHSAMHPDDSRDDDYLREHVESAKAAG